MVMMHPAPRGSRTSVCASPLDAPIRSPYTSAPEHTGRIRAAGPGRMSECSGQFGRAFMPERGFNP